ncbi:hypothetical protein SSX86_032174 [Deinandra increscens subsp. villosa]|uniref:HAT C-terminal dimerisation domain-containing protein n=1 Tax=Deinandra increscens subsp. villosa TaxID=3103831 RepID=A0AAP0C396_9ASTR
MQGSTSNPLQQRGQDQSSEEYINLDGDENINVPDENVNEAASVLDDNPSVQDDVKLKRKRQKTSTVWHDIIEVTLPDGTEKVQCIHCKEHLAISTGRPTTSWKRHMKKCFQKQHFMRSQKLLNLQPEDVDMTHSKSSPLVDTKYDPNKMRESMAHWLMATEQPFATVEDDMFVYMMKMANPMFERVSRNTIRADCFKVCDHEKKKLKALLNETSSVSITTDCWRSSHQKIEYMVITGHYIDNNWRLQKRVLSFVHVPPPRTGREIGYAISSCLKEWEIMGKIFSISVDNASYNDKVVSTLKDDLSRVKKLPCGGRLFHVRCCAHILNLLVKDGLSMIDSVIEEVECALQIMYDEYLEMDEASTKEATSQKTGSSSGSTASKPNEEASSSGWGAFGKFLKNVQVVTPKKSEIRTYLEEPVLMLKEVDLPKFNLLDWWNTHKLKYRVLSKMASDILGVPVSTVASEATFSAGGRVIDPFRSSLAPTTVEMLICGGDWIRKLHGVKKKLKVYSQTSKDMI